MTMEIKDGRYVSRIYFLSAKDAEYDVLGYLYRDPGKNFVLLYRFRYYAKDQSAGAWAPDEKHWTEVEMNSPDERQALKISDGLFNMAAAKSGLELDAVKCETDDARAIGEQLRSRPWAHAKQVPTGVPS